MAMLLAPFLAIGRAYNNSLQHSPLVTKSLTSGVMYGSGDLLCQTGESYHEYGSLPSLADIKWDRAAVIGTFGTIVGGPCYHYWFGFLDTLPMQMLALRQHRHKMEVVRAYNTVKRAGIKVGDLVVPDTAPLNPKVTKFVKILLDQLVFSSVYTTMFFMGVGTANVMTGVTKLQDTDAEREKRLPEASQVALRVLRTMKQGANYNDRDGHADAAIDEIMSTVSSRPHLDSAVAHAWRHTKDVFVKTYIADCVVWPPLQYINFSFVPVRLQVLYVNVCNLGWNTFLSFMANGHSDHSDGGGKKQ